MSDLQLIKALIEEATQRACDLRLRHIDEAAEFEMILNPLHKALTALTELSQK